MRNLSVLLGSAASGGSICAVRALGRCGYQVSVIGNGWMSPAGWSKYAVRCHSAPSERQTEQFLKRLREIGTAQPGQILLPTSDETAWLYTLHQEELSQWFRLYQPPVETMRRILDKELLSNAATKAGLAVLPSWAPRCLGDVEAIAGELPYPVLIKPRTHVHRVRNDKGVVARSREELITEYQRFVEREEHFVGSEPLLPDGRLPILQKFVDVKQGGVCSVSGFIDRSGELFVSRRCLKVFQRSQPVGVGVCFESAPEDAALSDAVRRLCRELGFFGIFEVEFVYSENGWAIIDFNGRLFNQTGLDVRRGMPLPVLACLAAAGETDRLREAVEKAQGLDPDCTAVLYDKFTFRAILTARSVTARIWREERVRWTTWAENHQDHAGDIAMDGDDPAPGYMHAISEVYLGLKAFPRFLRSTPRAPARGAAALAKAQL